MKTLLRSSLLALLAIGAFAGVATQSTAKFSGPGLGRPGTCCSTPQMTTTSTLK